MSSFTAKPPAAPSIRWATTTWHPPCGSSGFRHDAVAPRRDGSVAGGARSRAGTALWVAEGGDFVGGNWKGIFIYIICSLIFIMFNDLLMKQFKHVGWFVDFELWLLIILIVMMWNGSFWFWSISIFVGFVYLMMWGRMNYFDYLIQSEDDEPQVMCHWQ